MLSRTDRELRHRAILFARRRGDSLAALGRQHKLSRERVRQILKQPERNARSHIDPADEMSARLHNALLAEGCTLTPAAVRERFTSYRELKRVPNLGVKSIRELNEWLVRHGESPVA